MQLQKAIGALWKILLQRKLMSLSNLRMGQVLISVLIPKVFVHEINFSPSENCPHVAAGKGYKDIVEYLVGKTLTAKTLMGGVS